MKQSLVVDEEHQARSDAPPVPAPAPAHRRSSLAQLSSTAVAAERALGDVASVPHRLGVEHAGLALPPAPS
eukprot:COSAG03_NODE_2073_length_3155_cov_3.090314_2_plen_71_part_00